MARQLWRKRIERAFEQVGEEEIGFRLPQPRMGEPAGRDDPHQASHAVLARILGRGCCRHLVAVGRDDPAPERFGRGNGEDASACTEIDDLAGRAALEVIVEREQAAARARVMRRAEGLPRVDLDGEATARHLAPVVAAMDQKAPGLDLAALSLRQSHPVRGRKRLDLERADAGAVHRLSDQPEQSPARRWRIVMGENLEAAFATLEKSDRNRGRIDRRFERIGKKHRRLCWSLDPRLMGRLSSAPCHRSGVLA